MTDATAQDRFEDAKNEIALGLFKEALNFAAIDNRINASFATLMESVAAYVRENPNAFNTSKGLEDVLRELKASRGAPGGTAGGDTIGGSIIGDIIDLIKGVSGTLKDEKDFFFQIIRLIFCGCH